MENAVKCSSCEWEGMVEIGVDECPKCKEEGCLIAIDEHKEDVESFTDMFDEEA